MKVIHCSMECYPAAKAGGMGDVLGALPKYLTRQNVEGSVVIPKYYNKWILGQSFESTYGGILHFDRIAVNFEIQKLTSTDLGFNLYVIDIPGLFDRPGVYLDDNGHGYGDEAYRVIAYQKAVLQWLETSWDTSDLLVHCHDHHTGLIPFFMKYGLDFEKLRDVPVVYTIHNGKYQGTFSWDKLKLLPQFHGRDMGLLDWNYRINPLACAIKCSDYFTTVSNGYLNELRADSDGLEGLISQEAYKSVGIINGIDTEVWNPASDSMIDYHLKKSVRKFKEENKKAIYDKWQIQNKDLPFIVFIGRFADEKGADLLPGYVSEVAPWNACNLFILGSGNPYVQNQINNLNNRFPNMGCYMGYSEELAHKLYAAADFLLMPSRVEPCGLNQMYAMRYGAIPMVRRTGGLRDTVVDMGDGGYGICFDHPNKDDMAHATYRAIELSHEDDNMTKLQEYIMTLDFSWEHSASKYVDLYKKL